MEVRKPLKRHLSLQSLSREHHFGLLLCWKIRTGFQKSVEVNRIKAYSDWFFQTHLIPHFDKEEKLWFPLLGNSHQLIKKALTDHRRLARLFNDTAQAEKSLSLIEEELEAHIRFEERVLFEEIQKTVPESTLLQAMKQLEEKESLEDWHDPFWI